MRIVFDPDFDSGCWPGPLGARDASAGEGWVGPGGLLGILEIATGTGGPSVSTAERAAKLMAPLRDTDGFWSRSAEVDPFGSARRLLAWSDSLAMCGWNGGGSAPRLAQLAALVAQAPAGIPGRLAAVAARLPGRDAGIESVTLLTPLADFEPLWRTTLRALEAGGTRVVFAPLAPAAAAGDLAAAREAGFAPRGDGSLRLLRPAGSLAAAEEVAAWLASLPGRERTVLVGGDPALDVALRRHGLPTTGAEPAFRDGSLLQVLVLALELMWSPQDPQHALELLSLPASPVPRVLRYRLIRALNQWPAVDSDAWRLALDEGLTELDPDRREAIRERLGLLWAAAVPHGSPCPAGEIVRRASMLREWLRRSLATAPAGAADWRSALTQCDALLDLLDRAGLEELPASQLRRFVDEATRDSVAASAWPAQAGLSVVGEPGGVAGAAEHVVWWKFHERSVPAVTRLPLSPAERAALVEHGCELPDPGRAAAALALRWRRPLEQASHSLLLVCPERDAVGSEQFPHPLWDDLLARAAGPKARDLAIRSLAHAVPAPKQVDNVLLELPAPGHKWNIAPGTLARRDRESPYSAEALLGCSFHWALRYAGGLRGGDSLSLPGPGDPRLLGSLFHHVLERLLANPAVTPASAEADALAIFDREGPRLAAPLFLPGAETERAAVRRVTGRATDALFRMMSKAGVRVIASEQERIGEALGTVFAGRPDIVLGDPVRIVDMKWGGASWRRRQLAHGAATQLASYSFLSRASGDAPFPPVAYFIVSEQRVLTVSREAFPDAVSVEGPGPGPTWDLLAAAHAERWRDIERGVLRACGLPDEAGGEPPKESNVVEGRLVFQPPCKWCDFAGLCGRASSEGA